MLGRLSSLVATESVSRHAVEDDYNALFDYIRLAEKRRARMLVNEHGVYGC